MRATLHSVLSPQSSVLTSLPYWLQNLLVLLAVLACAAFVLRAAIRALRGKKSGLAGCGTCSGCAPTSTPSTSKPSSAPDAEPRKAERLVFLPSDLLAQRTRARKRES